MDTKIPHTLRLAFFGFVLTCSACEQGGEATAATGSDRPAGFAMPTSEIDNKAEPVEKSLSKKVAAAVADLSERAGVSPDAITVTRASFVNWGSSAVGCPKEGMEYMQVIVPGVLVLLEAGGKIYRYHGSEKSELFFCPDDRAEAPAYGSGLEFM